MMFYIEGEDDCSIMNLTIDEVTTWRRIMGKDGVRMEMRAPAEVSIFNMGSSRLLLRV